MALGICLRRAGLSVDLIDADREWRPVGAGLSLNGASLRAFERIGVLGEVSAAGHVHSAFELRDVSGRLLQRAETPPGPTGIPSGGGILRPVLHEILAGQTRALGVRVRLGVRLASLRETGGHVLAHCTDGEQEEYDLVVGADGLHSQVRTLLFPHSPRPRFTGQGCWRAVFARPRGLDCVQMYMDTVHKAGLNPVSSAEMYMFLLEHVPDNRRMPEERWVELLAAQLEPFGGIWPQLRASLDARSRINYRPLETLLLSPPWHRGGVILIGDAAHATTPHVAYGCGLAVEDAVVLAEELGNEASLEDALTRFTERRFERCRAVVEGSARLGELEMAQASLAEHQAVTMTLTRLIAQPI
jgi:2-polyprenyl-6-methoxyphenol hydroxylase-like FAD-dependent oxidoreductase